MRETIYNCYIDIVTIQKQPERLVAQVRMTRATLLRSRMNGNVHVRFWSRVEVATPRLRQRGDSATRLAPAQLTALPLPGAANTGQCPSCGWASRGRSRFY